MDEFTPRKVRHPMAVTAHVFRPNGCQLAVTITEMSDNGCRIEGGETLPIGEAVRIAIPNMGQIHAQIRWSLGGAAGARFDHRAHH